MFGKYGNGFFLVMCLWGSGHSPWHQVHWLKLQPSGAGWWVATTCTWLRCRGQRAPIKLLLQFQLARQHCRALQAHKLPWHHCDSTTRQLLAPAESAFLQGQLIHGAQRLVLPYVVPFNSAKP